MNETNLVSIDLAKRVFQVEGSDGAGHRLWERRVRREQLIVLVGTLAPTEIAMEACASAHHWGRQFTALGHKVRLKLPRFRGHPNICVPGVRNGQEECSL